MTERITLQRKDALTLLRLHEEGEVVRVHMTADFEMGGDESLLIGFFTDMLVRGSKKYTKDVYEETLESLGAQVTISSSESYFHIDIIARKKTIPQVLEVLADTIRSPLFVVKEIGNLKKEYTQHLYEERDDSRALSYGIFTRYLYLETESGYIPDIKTRLGSLNHIDRNTLISLHTTLLGLPWTVSIASDRDTATQITDIFSALHTRDILESGTKTNNPPKVLKSKKDLFLVPEKQNIEFYIGNRLPLTLADEAFLPFSFGLDVLGKRGGFAGRLMSTVREKEGLTYSIYAWIKGVTKTHSGHWQIWTFFTPKDTPQGLTSTIREIRTIVEKGSTDVEIKRYKELLSNQFRLAHESTTSTLSLYHSALVAGRTPEEVDQYPNRIQKLTKKAINDALRAYLTPDALVICGAGAVEPVRESGLKKKKSVTQ